MGRARSQTHAVSGFEAVLGTRRGSVAAQAQRDINEDEQRKAALLGFPEQVGEVLRREPWGLNGQAIASSLVCDYEDHVSEKSSRQRLLKNWRELDESIPNNHDTLPGLVVIVELGDPLGSPGLTEPAMQALCDYFVFSAAAEVHSDRVRAIGDNRLIHERAAWVINKLFRSPRAPAHYLRFARLCEVLSPIIAGNTLNEDADGQFLGIWAAMSLRAAPEEALTGPMRGWVDAFTEVVNADAIIWEEEQELNQLVAQYGPSGDGAVALVDLARALSKLNNVNA
jgi:hypothetical protein